MKMATARASISEDADSSGHTTCSAIDRRQVLVLAWASLVASIMPREVRSETIAAWPSRPVKLVVPFSPGGPTDTVARLVSERLHAIWKQAVLLDYRPGAGTTVGTDYVARAPADGYTLGMAISAFMLNPSLQPKLPYDTRRDLVGVSQVCQAHYGLFAYPSAPFNTVAELIAYARKNPGKLSYATPGVGTGTHLAGEMLDRMAGIEMVHVPYKGSAPAEQDVIAGRVPLLFDVLFSAVPFVKEGRLKAIALASPKRAIDQPQIPTINETVPGFSATSVIGIIAPSGVPKALVKRISADIAAAVKSPELSAELQQLGMEPVGSTNDEYDAVIGSEIDKWARVIKAAGIKPE
jgi:tripartite-type tricarboxylate transporter receptor subunit TctC